MLFHNALTKMLAEPIQCLRELQVETDELQWPDVACLSWHSRTQDSGNLATNPRCEALLAKVFNLQRVGRNGMRRHNKQYHSLLTAKLAARNVAGARFDLWNLSVNKDYLEAGTEISNEKLAGREQNQPLVPKAI